MKFLKSEKGADYNILDDNGKGVLYYVTKYKKVKGILYVYEICG